MLEIELPDVLPVIGKTDPFINSCHNPDRIMHVNKVMRHPFFVNLMDHAAKGIVFGHHFLVTIIIACPGEVRIFKLLFFRLHYPSTNVIFLIYKIVFLPGGHQVEINLVSS